MLTIPAAEPYATYSKASRIPLECSKLIAASDTTHMQPLRFENIDCI